MLIMVKALHIYQNTLLLNTMFLCTTCTHNAMPWLIIVYTVYVRVEVATHKCTFKQTLLPLQWIGNLIQLKVEVPLQKLANILYVGFLFRFPMLRQNKSI